MKLRVKVRRYLLVSCHNGSCVRDLIVTFSPEEVEYFSERLLCHQVEMTEKLKHPLEILAASLPKIGVFLFCEEISDVSKIRMERNSEHECGKDRVLNRQGAIDDLPVI